jgi:hypothetical protein
MKSKRKPKSKAKAHKRAKYPPGQSPTEIGRAAGCSHVLAHRLLRRGMSPAEIVERCRLRREQEAARRAAGGGNGGGNGRAPVNGASTRGANGSESFVDAQRRKESALADERELRVAERRGALIPIAAVNAWYAAQIVKARDLLLRLPAELRDQFDVLSGPECERLLDGELRRILHGLTEFGKQTARPDAKPEDRTTPEPTEQPK